MKKSDPTGTGITIEYPESRASGDFPYGGFWSIVGTSAFDAVKLDGASYQDRQNVQLAIRNLINGPGRVFLADKLYTFGETINLNGRIPLNGETAGYALGTVPENVNDNGHLFVAMKVMEKPMQELWSSVLVKSESYENAEEIQPLIEEALTALYEKQVNLQQVIQTIPTESEMSRQTNIVNGLANELTRFTTDRDTLHGEISRIQEELSTSNILRNEANQLQLVVNNTNQYLRNKLEELRNASAERRATVHEEAMSLQNEYRNSSNRLQAIQITLSRMNSLSDGGAIQGMQELLQKRNLEVDTAGGNLSNATVLLQNMSSAYESGVAQAEGLRAEIDELTTTVFNLRQAYEQATSYSNSIMNLSDNDLIKVFADHLDGAQMELESMLFQVLRESSDELLAEKESMMEVVSSQDVKEYEEYLEALADVEDAFTPDETTLLRMIGDFGYSRDYVPGASRIYALVSMGPTDRRRAYRTLIEEILTLGTSTASEGFFSNDSPFFKLELALKRKDADLRELAQLIEFLTDRRPDIQY